MDREELFRLSTFYGLPENANVSPLTLARSGFSFYEAQGTIRCEACNVGFDPLEYSNSSILDRHREQTPNCPVALATSAPNTSHGLQEFSLPVGGDTVSDYKSPIGPGDRRNDEMQHASTSALARAAFFQGNSGTNTGRSGSLAYSSSDGHVVYTLREHLQKEESSLYTLCNWHLARNTSPDLPRFGSPDGGHAACDYGSRIERDDRTNDNLQDTLRSAFARATRRGVFRANCGSTTYPGSSSPPASLAYPQVSSQGQAVYRREQPDYEQEQSEAQSADTFRNLPVGNQSTDAASAVMDREEISILLPIIRNLGFNEDDLRMLVAERLFQGDDCLIPTQLLEALLLKHQRP